MQEVPCHRTHLRCGRPAATGAHPALYSTLPQTKGTEIRTRPGIFGLELGLGRKLLEKLTTRTFARFVVAVFKCYMSVWLCHMIGKRYRDAAPEELPGSADSSRDFWTRLRILRQNHSSKLWHNNIGASLIYLTNVTGIAAFSVSVAGRQRH